MTGTAVKRDLIPPVLLAALVALCKIPTLHTPPYWDEMSWVSAAHWLWEGSLWRALPGFYPPAMFFGHPPGLHAALAAVWKLTGDSISVAHGVALVFAVAGVCFTYRLGRLLYDTATGVLAALFLFLSPLFFAQSGMFLGDVPVTALGTMSVYYALRDRYRAYLLCAIPMVLIKETGVAVVVAILGYLALAAPSARAETVQRLLRYGAPLAAIGVFMAWQKVASGHFFWVFDFDVRLIEFDRSLAWPKLVRVTDWLFVHQLRYVFTFLIVLHLLSSQEFRRRRELRLFALIGLLSGYSFCVLYFLPRYLLPVLPFFYLVGAWSLLSLARSRVPRLAGSLVLLALAAWSLPRQPFEGNAEFNLGYRDVVALHVAAGHAIESDFSSRRIVTSWPHTFQLTRPFLGYVRRPLTVVPLETTAVRANDLIVVSVPGTHSDAGELRALAEQHAWQLVRRFQYGEVIVALYGRALR